MKKMRFLILSALIVVSSLVYGEYVSYYRNLAGDTNFVWIDVAHTKASGESYLTFVRGQQNPEFKLSFVAPDNCQAVDVKCHQIISGIPLPLIVPTLDPTWGMNLPLQRGQMYDCCVTIPCRKSDPPIKFVLRIELYAKDTGRLIAGADIDVKVI